VIKYIQPVKAESAESLVAQVYAQIKRDFGALVEPFTLHSPSPKLLAGAWIACRETELVGNVRRDIKEAVAAAVSKINQCPYCVDAHTIMLNATGKRSVASAVSNENYDQIADSEARAVVKWALATRSPESEILLSPPFSRKDAPEIIGTTVFFHYVNRMASVLLSETPLPSNSRWLKNTLKLIAGLSFSRAARRPKASGDSLKLLPEAELPAGLEWAKTNPTIAGAFARFAAVIEEAGASALSAEIRTCVQEYVQTWNGEASGLNRQWVEQAISGFNDNASKAAGGLALLTALAPYQVDEGTVHVFRAYFPHNDKLLSVLAWASFTAARRIGTWLHVPE
jgi:AhpD family alkylhydroperoxidase